jgi:hypothetical protein
MAACAAPPTTSLDSRSPTITGTVSVMTKEQREKKIAN